MIIDRLRWNSKYSSNPDDGFPAPDELLTRYKTLLTAGRALDVACGKGGNSLFLAEQGYSVDALDISDIALKNLRRVATLQGFDINPLIADLDYFPIPENMYDLVIVFYFFSKDLMPKFNLTLKSGGLLFYATYNFRHIAENPTFNSEYLVPPGGLGMYLPGFEIVLNEPEAGDLRNLSRFIGKKK